MQKKCLIMMPTSDPDGYSQGHVNRVYEYIIVPACRLAGFWPERANNPNTSNTASDILKNIIDSDLAICDLSSNNSDVLYGLAIRQALGLPLTVIKDLKTTLGFTISEFDQVEYDESLRIDTVQKEVENLRAALEKTFANKPDVNSLLIRLGIGPGRIIEAPTISFATDTTVSPPTDEPTQVDEEPKEIHLPIISPLPDYVGDPITEDDIEKLKVGNFIFHMNHGKGEISTIKKMGKDKIANIQFESGPIILVLGTSGFFRKINS